MSFLGGVPLPSIGDDHGIKMENDKREGVYIDTSRGKVPVRVYAHEWLSLRAVKETTRGTYGRYIDGHLIPRLGRKTMAGVGAGDIERMCLDMVESGLSAVNEKCLPEAKAVGEMARAIRSDWEVAIWLMAGCGLRIGELPGVKPSDIEDGTLRLRRQSVRVKRDGVWAAERAP